GENLRSADGSAGDGNRSEPDRAGGGDRPADHRVGACGTSRPCRRAPSARWHQRGRYRLRSAVAVCAGRTSASRSSSTVIEEKVDWSSSTPRYRLHASAKSLLPARWTTT